MNKIISTVLFIVFLALFISCPEGALYEPTEEEIYDLVVATEFCGFIGFQGTGSMEEGEGLDIEEVIGETSATATYTFTDYDFQVGETEFLTLNGVIVLESTGGQIIVTYSSFSMNGDVLENELTISATISGSMTLVLGDTSTEQSIDFSISGIADESVDVIFEMVIPMEEGDPDIILATVNGYDAADIFLEVIDSLFTIEVDSL